MKIEWLTKGDFNFMGWMKLSDQVKEKLPVQIIIDLLCEVKDTAFILGGVQGEIVIRRDEGEPIIIVDFLDKKEKAEEHPELHIIEIGFESDFEQEVEYKKQEIVTALSLHHNGKTQQEKQMRVS